ncbi:MAG: chloride channel protein [Gammaproteobacteria bacterium]|nr:chloride channel protein [Gammaproteobacteria bacterium]
MIGLEPLRQRLAREDALVPLAVLGLLAGAITGAVIIAFRLAVELPHLAVPGMTSHEDFESLDPVYRFALPVLGGLAVGLLFTTMAVGARQVGVVHVMERLAFHAGRMPWRNALLQFLGGALAIITGHSVGREGPVIHVGAASASLLGQWLRLPNNSIRVLVACGVAAGIAASFNTPLAGVIFAMEVVMMEYTLLGFTPVILAAVAATSLSYAVHGGAPAFAVPQMQLASLWELPYFLLVGALLGTLASAFITGVQFLDVRARRFPLWIRTTTAGVVVGLCGLASPAVLGIGYDTVGMTLLGEAGLGFLAALVVWKLIASVACIGLGVPGGLIGPTLVMGAAAGGALGLVGHQLAPELSATSPFYAVLGMGAMMGATLQAPLAALMAIMELTANPGSILPGMTVIVTATLTTRVLFRRSSIFIAILQGRGVELRPDPVALALSRTGVRAAMSRRFVTAPAQAGTEDLERLARHDPEWMLVARDGDLVGVLDTRQKGPGALPAPADGDEQPKLDLQALAATGFASVRSQATLREALDVLDREGVDVVLVTAAATRDPGGVLGVLSRDQIEAAVRYGGWSRAAGRSV